MYVQLKSGFDSDAGPAWISLVEFSRSWRTAYWHERTLARRNGIAGNVLDLDTGQAY